MSLPPGDMQAAPDKTARRARGIKCDWVLIGVLTFTVSATSLIIDIVLGPDSLPHATQAGNLPALLSVAGMGFFVSAAIYGLFIASGRYTRVGAYAERGMPRNDEVVGLGPLAWCAAGIWLVAVVATSLYAIRLALMHPLDRATLLLSFAMLGCALVVAIGGLGWIWWRAGRNIRMARAATPLASILLPAETPAKRQQVAVPSAEQRVKRQQVAVPPDKRLRWSIVFLMGLGLFAFSLLTFAVLDLYVILTNQRIFAVIISCFSWAGIYRASARCYPATRLRRLFVAAAAFVVADDALVIGLLRPSHAIVSPLWLLAIALICATLGVLICRSMLLHPMWDVGAVPNVATPPDFAPSHDATVASGQKRPRVAPYLVLLQPVFIVAVYSVYFYGTSATINEWGSSAFAVVWWSFTATLESVVNTDMPQAKARRAVKKGS